MKTKGMNGNQDDEQRNRESGIVLVHGWKFRQYELGGDVNSKTHIDLKKGDNGIEMTRNYVTNKFQIKADKNTPVGYVALRFETKSFDDAKQQIEALMDLI